MSSKSVHVPADLQIWVVARDRHRLSHAHVQMARELGMNPKKLGKLDNHDQEPWKAPLPLFLEHLYEKRFGRSRPERVLRIEDLARERRRKQEDRKRRKKEGVPESNGTQPDESDQPNCAPGRPIG